MQVVDDFHHRVHLAERPALGGGDFAHHRDEVVVTRTDQGATAVFEIQVAPDDIGKVIGKRGRTAQSIRTLLSAAGSKIGKRTGLEIIE